MKGMKPLDYTIILSSIVILGVVLFSVDFRRNEAKEVEGPPSVLEKKTLHVSKLPDGNAGSFSLKRVNVVNTQKVLAKKRGPHEPYGDYEFRLNVDDSLKDQSDML